MFKLIALAAMLFATTVAAQAVDPVEAGRRVLAERSVADQMTDPESARFRWTQYPARIVGHLAFDCGMVNAKNTMGGYVGYRWFWVRIEDGAVTASHIDSADDDKAAKYCEPWAD